MANRLIKHFEDYSVSPNFPQSNEPKEPDKSKSISELNMKDLQMLVNRLRLENEAEFILKELNRNAGKTDTFDKPLIIDTITPVNQLYHYGIKGQKWYVRRFQKADGSLTSEGKKRYADSDDYIESRARKERATRGLSNDELRRLNERLQLENTYRSLSQEKLRKSESFVQKALRDAAGQALTDFSKNVMLGGAKLLVSKVSPQFANIAFNIKQDKKKD